MIVIIDYGMGNVGSIVNMFKKIDVEAVLSSDHGEIAKADKLILPGVGVFDQGMRRLEDFGLIPLLDKRVLIDKVPILGICLGMQLFTKRSQEGVSHGLGWIDAEVIRFRINDMTQRKLNIPHMGWNTARIKKQSGIFNNLDEASRFYFLHSYHVQCADESDVLTTTCHGYDFVSSLQRDNIVGVQFHPEKSHKFGMVLMKNFSEL
jgi:glutamine amidotransferase